jgi:hypothetical protein
MSQRWLNNFDRFVPRYTCGIFIRGSRLIHGNFAFLFGREEG